jgi:hypothetical protein
MTTVISRIFPDEAAARGAVDRLIFKGVPKRECDVFVTDDDATRLEKALVHPDAVAAYEKAMQTGQAVVVVRTTYRPLGAAKLTREVLDQRGGLETAGITEDHFVTGTGARARSSILQDHPLLMTSPYEMQVRGPVTESVGMAMLSPSRTKRSAMSGGRFMSRAFWPMPLISRKQRKSSVISGGRHMSKIFWPRPFLSSKARRKSVMTGGGGPAIARFLGVPSIR